MSLIEFSFLFTGTVFFILESGRHLFTIYMAREISKHEMECEECQEQERIREIRRK
jgi:hypothetical protein